jgi:hypothetical protein
MSLIISIKLRYFIEKRVEHSLIISRSKYSTSRDQHIQYLAINIFNIFHLQHSINVAQKERFQWTSKVDDKEISSFSITTQCWSSQRILFTIVFTRFFNLAMFFDKVVNRFPIFARIENEDEDENENEFWFDWLSLFDWFDWLNWLSWFDENWFDWFDWFDWLNW